MGDLLRIDLATTYIIRVLSKIVNELRSPPEPVLVKTGARMTAFYLSHEHPR